jgi:PhnB protein
MLSDQDEAKRVFASLAEGGVVQMELSQTFWSPAFGSLVDRFGVSWMINVDQPESA